MPPGMTNIDQRFPQFKGSETQEQKLRIILDYLFMLREYLQYVLNNLSPDNFNQTALDGLIDEIRAGVVVADTMISNTVITNNLYAEYGNIAELTVDRLMTDDKVYKYLGSSTADVNYIKIQDQTISFITASTDGSATEQLVNRNGELLYWNEAGATTSTFKTIGMTTTPTAYPVLIYDYTELTKAKISFDLDADTGYYLPKITLGAGSSLENPLLGKGYIWKDATGMTLRYTKYDGTNVDLHIGEDGITGITGNSSSFGIQVTFTENAGSITISSAEMTLGGIPLNVSTTTDVPVFVSLTGTPADATHLTISVYLDSTLKVTRKLLALTTDEQSFCCTGILKDVPEGNYVVTFKAVAADANIAIAANGFLGYALIPNNAYDESEILYGYGDQCTDITGGWIDGVLKYDNGLYNRDNVVFLSDTMQVAISGSGWRMCTAETDTPIDITDWNTLHVLYDAITPATDSGKWSGFGVCTEGSWIWDTETKLSYDVGTDIETTKDVSALTGMKVIQISVGTNAGYSADYRIKKVWLTE